MDPHGNDEHVATALRRLPRELTPPSQVRENLRMHLRPNRRVTPWYIAAAAAMVIAAFTAGRLSAPRPAPAAAGQKFALLLYGGATGSGDDRAAEYGAWAVAARRAGRAVSGERLADGAFVAGAAISDPAPLRGFFIVHATDAAEAFELARRHPHARDGTIVVRPINTP
jgi:hypothetical protein